MPDHRLLEGQIAWVTGSSRGLGRAIATHLGHLGASLVVHGTTPTSGLPALVSPTCDTSTT